MSTQFKTLFTLSVTHEYYGGVCQDFDFVTPGSTRKLLDNGKLLGKVRDGVLHCLFEAGDGGAALKPLAGAKLVFGLRLLNPHFNNFTIVDSANRRLLYRNQAAPAAFDAAIPLRLSGNRLRHPLLLNSGPVDLNLLDAAGQTLQTHALDSSVDDEFNLDLGGLDGGYYRVEEDDGVSPQTTDYYVEAELQREGVFAVAEITVDPSFYTSAPAFEIAFSARLEVLKYYVVAKNYSNSEFASLAITDQGFAEEGRSEIVFDRIPAASFTGTEIAPELLAQGDDRVDVFQSQSALARQHRARRHLQLSRNGDVLIAHLPAPGVDKARSELIIHVAKP